MATTAATTLVRTPPIAPPHRVGHLYESALTLNAPSLPGCYAVVKRRAHDSLEERCGCGAASIRRTTRLDQALATTPQDSRITNRVGTSSGSAAWRSSSSA